MADLKPVSMKRTEADKRGDKLEAAPMEATAPDYPWGLCIHLDKDELDKLGMGKLPAIGATFTLAGTVKATRVSQSAAEDSEESTSVDFQITDLAIG